MGTARAIPIVIIGGGGELAGIAQGIIKKNGRHLRKNIFAPEY